MQTLSSRSGFSRGASENAFDWPLQWHCLSSPAASAAENMAVDLALLQTASAEGRSLLRTYSWERPTVSFGRNEPVLRVWDVNAMHSGGLDVVRRPTGGRALLHHREVTYSVTMPLSPDIAWRAAYSAVNARLAAALRAIGVPASIETGGTTLPLSEGTPICFAAPSQGELVVGSAKVTASAVWRTNTAYLQHGSIILHDDQGLLAQFRRRTGTRDTAVAAPVSAWIPDADTGELAARVISSLHMQWSIDERELISCNVTPDFTRALNESRELFSSPAWLWRR